MAISQSLWQSAEKVFNTLQVCVYIYVYTERAREGESEREGGGRERERMHIGCLGMGPLSKLVQNPIMLLR